MSAFHNNCSFLQLFVDFSWCCCFSLWFQIGLRDFSNFGSTQKYRRCREDVRRLQKFQRPHALMDNIKSLVSAIFSLAPGKQPFAICCSIPSPMGTNWTIYFDDWKHNIHVQGQDEFRWHEEGVFDVIFVLDLCTTMFLSLRRLSLVCEVWLKRLHTVLFVQLFDRFIAKHNVLFRLPRWRGARPGSLQRVHNIQTLCLSRVWLLRRTLLRWKTCQRWGLSFSTGVCGCFLWVLAFWSCSSIMLETERIQTCWTRMFTFRPSTQNTLLFLFGSFAVRFCQVLCLKHVDRKHGVARQTRRKQKTNWTCPYPRKAWFTFHQLEFLAGYQPLVKHAYKYKKTLAGQVPMHSYINSDWCTRYVYKVGSVMFGTQQKKSMTQCWSAFMLTPIRRTWRTQLCILRGIPPHLENLEK